jgi:probable HAF family extracellular repeat protein
MKDTNCKRLWRSRIGHRFARLVAVTIGIVLVASIGGASAATPTYTMIDLGTLPGGSGGWATAVNESGQVVGRADIAGGYPHAFLWTRDEGIVDLGALLPPGMASEAVDVNAAGQVVGNFSGQTARMFSWTPADGMTEIPSLGGFNNRVTDVSDAGEVVGYSQTSTGELRAFVWNRSHGMTDLGTLGGRSSSASAVNTAGQVVGWSEVAAGVGHAFLWTRTSGMRDLGTIGGIYSAANAISDAGHVAGSALQSDGSTHPFVWTEESGMLDLGMLLPPGRSSSATAVNSDGRVIGPSYEPNGVAHVFTWTAATGIADLGTLGGRSSWVGTRAMNEDGQVAGYSDTDGGPPHAFSWTAANGMVDLGTLPGFSHSIGFAVGPNGWVAGTSGRPVIWVPLDTTGPTLSVPSGLAVDATSPTGAEVSFDVSATDDVDPEPVVSCTPASGSWFGLGDTTVACTATDASGNTASATFVVHVRSALEQLVGAGDDLEGLALTGRQANVRRDSALAFLEVASEPLRWTTDGGQPRTSDEGRYALLRIRQTVQYLRTPDAELAGASASIRQRLIGLVGMLARSRYDEVSSTPGASTSRLVQARTSLEQAAEQPGTIEALYDYVNAWTVLRAEAPQH